MNNYLQKFQSIHFITMPIIHFSLLILLSLLSLSSSSSCNRQCGETKVPYPFGFSPSCNISLSCNPKSGISFSTFPLLNFTTSNTVLLSLPSNCTRNIASLSSLFGSNHAMTSRNGLFLRNCTPNVTYPSSCVLPTALISQMSHFKNSCGSEGDNITCISNTTGNYISEHMVVQHVCTEVFTSVLFETNENQGQTVLVLGTVEMGWWMTGDCRCAANASCTRVGQDGYQCVCNQGFVGDGFAEGDGCVTTTKPYIWHIITCS